MIRFLAAAVSALGLSACSPAPPSSGALGVNDAVISVHGEVGAGYFTLVNDGPADKLIAVSSPAAKAVEMHVSEMKNDMMSMRRLESVDAPARGSVDFVPGGRHLMLFQVTPGLAEEQGVPITLTFEKAGAKEFTFTVMTGLAPARSSAPHP
jgi:copper(I)-binding protein